MSNRIIVGLLALVVVGVGVWGWGVLTDEDGPDLDSGRTAATDGDDDAVGGARRREGAAESGDAITDSQGTDEPRRSPSQGDGAEVTLRVVDAGGEPLADIPVELLVRRGSALRPTAAGDRRRVTTDARGDAAFTGLEAELRVEVRVRSPLHADQVVTVPSRLQAGERIDLGVVVLAEGGSVTGRVYGVNGAPAVGVPVLAWSPLTSAKGGNALAARAAAMRLGTRDEDARETVTDAEGRYRIDGLGEGQILVRARPARAPQRERRGLECVAGEVLSGIDFQLIEGWALAGRVVQKDEVPIPKAALFINAQGEGALLGRLLDASGSEPDTITDAEGRFRIEGLDPELSYRIAASATGFVDRQRIQVPKGPGEDLTIALDPAPYVEVRVTDDKDAPLETAFRIDCDPGRSVGSQTPVAFYGQDAADLLGVVAEPGLAFIGDVRTGLLRFRVSAKGRATATMTLRGLKSGDRKVVTVPLPPAVALAGRVLDDEGTPIVGAKVAVRRPRGATRNEFDVTAARPGGASREGLLGQATTDENGAFRVEALPAGKLLAQASHRRHARSEPQSFELEASREDLEFRLARTATLRGRVLSAEGEPLPRARVTLVKEGDAPTRRGRGRRQTTADAQGNYVFERLSPGTYRAVPMNPGTAAAGPFGNFDAARAGRDGQGEALTLAVAEELVRDLRVPPSASIRGRVTMGGAPQAGITVKLAAAPREGMPAELAGSLGGRRTRTDANGEYLFRDVKPGDRRLTVRAPGAPTDTVREVAVAGTSPYTVDIELPAGSVAGVVVDQATGEPLSGIQVSLRQAGTDEAAAADNPRGLRGRGLDELLSRQRRPRTDEQGAFRIDAVDTGDYELVVEARGYETPAPVAVRVADGPVTGLEISITRAPVLALRVTREGDLPVGTFPVASVQVRDARGEVQARRMAALGRVIEITDLPEGTYTVEVKLGERVIERSAGLSSGQVTELDVALD